MAAARGARKRAAVKVVSGCITSSAKLIELARFVSAR